MPTTDSITVLNRLLTIVSRSLPSYLADARPWSRSDARRLRGALERLATDQRMYARRLAEAIVARGGRPAPGNFSATMAAKNDLAIEYLLPAILDDLRRAADAVRRCSARLEDRPDLHALAEEIGGNLQGHADALRELAAKLKESSIS